jgi:hypothetical protein
LFFAQASCCTGSHNRIRKVSPNGVITTLTSAIGGGDITVGPDGSLFVQTGQQIYRIDPVTGDTALFAGNGNSFTHEQLLAGFERGGWAPNVVPNAPESSASD